MKFNIGTKLVYDSIYKKILPSHHVKSNFIAECSDELKNYIEYASEILGTPKAKAIFTRIDIKNYYRLRRELTEFSHILPERINIVNRSIWNMQKSCRVEDYGIGDNSIVALQRLVPLLNKQQKLPTTVHKKGKWVCLTKVQIITGGTVTNNFQHFLRWLNKYLKIVDTEVLTINGTKSSKLHTWTDLSIIGDIVSSYIDPATPNPNTVRNVKKYTVKLVYGKRLPKLYMYTHYSYTGNVVTLVLVYK
jgi:hypothetical protein